MPHIRTLYDNNDIVTGYINHSEINHNTYSGNSSSFITELNNIKFESISDDMNNTKTGRSNNKSPQ